MLLLVLVDGDNLYMLDLLCHREIVLEKTMVAKPSVLNSLIGVVSSGGHSKGLLPAIIDLIACSSVCTCCTLGMNELLGLLPVPGSDISSVGGPWLGID